MSASFLSGCEDTTETFTYATVDACVAARVYTPEACKKGFDEARAQTDKVAPKFAAKADCEEEFGQDQCGPAPASTGSNSTATSSTTSSFMPFMVGYLMGKSFSNGSIANQPLYRSRSGGYFTAGGTEVTKKLGTATKVRPSTVGAPKATTTTLGRGGFGAGRGGFSS